MSAEDGPLPTTAPPPLTSALLRARPEDFAVAEELGFPLTGGGEHVWLRVRKRGLNTDQVAAHLARHAGVSRRNVSYSGMKDRHAVTEQWFSIWSPRDHSTDWRAGMPAGVEILDVTRHARKLQRGAHRANRFAITLRECAGEAAAVERRLAEIARDGVPNYFGEQRFGRDGDNVARAEAMFAGTEVVREAASGPSLARGPRLGPIGDKHRRGIYLSAARSFLFNRVLARRVADGSWNRLLPGEAVMLDGKNSFFVDGNETRAARQGCRDGGFAEDDVNDELRERLDRHDIHPSGPLWGEGELPSRGEARALEEAVLAGEGVLTAGLAAAGLRQERRALRLMPAGFAYRWLADGIEVTIGASPRRDPRLHPGVEARAAGQIRSPTRFARSSFHMSRPDCGFDASTLQLEFTLPRGAYATAVLRELADYRNAAAFGAADSGD